MASDLDDDLLQMLSKNFIENVQDSVEKYVASCSNYAKLSAHVNPLDNNSAKMEQSSDEQISDMQHVQESLAKAQADIQKKDFMIQEGQVVIKLLSIILKLLVICTKYSKQKKIVSK